MNVLDFQKMKNEDRKISMVTWARIGTEDAGNYEDVIPEFAEMSKAPANWARA
jgi:hypothetical protein